MQTDRTNRGDAAPEFIHASSYRPVARRSPLLSQRGRRVALIAALLAPAALVLYLLATVRPVAFEVTPENATVTLSGGSVLTLGGRRFLRHGNYRLYASAPDHHDGDQEFEVVAGSGMQRVELKLVPLAPPVPDPATPLFGNATLPAVVPNTVTLENRDHALGANIAPTPVATQTVNVAAPAATLESVADTLPKTPGAAPTQNLEEVPAEQESGATSPNPVEHAADLVAFTPVRYTLGSSRREHGRRANEVQREVLLSRPFLVARHEVSTHAYREFKPAHKAVTTTGEPLDLDDQAVANVSWQDAALYCNWLSTREQLPSFYRITDGKVVGFDSAATGYRLPSDAEWEWAARGQPDGALLRFAWGEEFAPPKRFGNYADSSARPLLARILADYDDGFRVTAPPGQFAANAWGLFDLSGNVAEWVHDVYDIEVQDGGDAAPENPLGKPNGRYHVIRGSSWAHSGVSELRLAFRDYSDRPREDVGFRVARYQQ